MLQRTYTARYLLGLLCFLGILTSGCASGGNLDTAEDIKLTLTTNPNPPRTGDGQIILRLARSDGQPISDVKVSVSVTASGMKSGSQDGMAINQGNGRYIYPVSFHMQTRYAVRVWIYRGEKVIAIQDSTINLY